MAHNGHKVPCISGFEIAKKVTTVAKEIEGMSWDLPNPDAKTGYGGSQQGAIF